MKKKDSIPEQTNCTKCGGLLLKADVPAENYSGPLLFSIYASRGYERFNKKGERQFLTRFRCENFGERKGLFRRRVEHDSFARRKEGFDYEDKIIFNFF